MNASDEKRVDTASRIIKAAPHAIYAAFLDPQAVAAWRPPGDMKCEIFEFEPHQGGKFRMAFAYKATDHKVSGKTSEHADVFQGRFAELVPDQRIVEEVEFESSDPAFAGTMRVITILTPVREGTQVTFRCENVPSGIQPGDHELGMTSTLANLAAFTE